jgi:type IV secretion system protein VirB2
MMQRVWPMLRLSSFFTIVWFVLPLAAHAQGSSPFDAGFTSLQNLFTGTIAKVASLIAIVIGGYGFAHGEPGAKKVANDQAGWVLALGPVIPEVPRVCSH